MKRIHAFGLWSKVFVVGAVLAVASMTVAQTTSSAAPQVTQQIDERQTVTLNGNVSPLATAQNQGAVAPDGLLLGKMTLVLKRSAAQETALKDLLDKQQNPKSPLFHRWLTPAEFGQQFGVAAEDLQKVTAWLQSQGLKVESVSPGRNFVTFSGTHGQLRNAFHTEVHAYTINGQKYWSNATDPKVPAALAPVISGFVSLNNFPKKALHTTTTSIRKDKSGHWVRTEPAGQASPLFNTTISGHQLFGVSPYDFAKIYNVLPLWNEGIDGTGQTIAIVSNSDIDPADVDAFRSTFGLPQKKLNIIYVGDNPGKSYNEGEADLDVQWAGAVAKNATIDLVVASDSAMGSGVDFASIYIVSNNLASIMNVSYGACERLIEAAGNQFYNELWREAAAQGITVMVAAGDAGAAACDQGQSSSYFGLGVNGIASTPYTVAVGGTDLYGTYTANDKYWESSNDPATLASAKSYMPELPWNNSCASPQILSALQNIGVTDDAPETLCNDYNQQAGFLSTLGAGGGRSSCSYSTGSGYGVSCEGGWEKPAWQTSVPGIPDDGVRDLPDVSLMAGNGIWGAFYVFCQSDATVARQCDVNTEVQGAGGTSFGAPAFAGIVALLQQKTASKQGNINYVLYRLAASQYGNDIGACDSSTVGGDNSCMFYDVTQGTNSVPCYSFGYDCVVNDGADMYGVLPGFDAGVGYDMATGIGSVNAYNLIHGWSTAAATFLPTVTTLTGSGTTFSYGTPLDLAITVNGTSPDAGTPTGDVGITSNIQIPNKQFVAGSSLDNGGAALHTEMLPGGTYQLSAHYTGDATFAPSDSAPLQITVMPAATPSTLTRSRAGLTAGETVTFFLKVAGITNGVTPTGKATFTDTTTGQVLGEASFDPYVTPDAAPRSVAYLNVSAAKLATGENNITASYSGDANYAASTPDAVNVVYTPPFAVAVTPNSLTLDVSTGKTITTTIVVMPNVGSVSAASLNFSCPSNLPLGLTCSFSAPTPGPAGSYSSVLTVAMGTTPVPSFRVVARNHSNAPLQKLSWVLAGALTGLAGLVMVGLPGRKNKAGLIVALFVISTLSLTVACGGGSKSTENNAPPTPIATTVALSTSSSTPDMNSTVTLTAIVTPASGAGIPTGSIAFMDGTTNLGSSNLASGKATFSSSTLAVGDHALTAKYSGDSSYTASTSSAITIDVTFASTVAVSVSDKSTGYSTTTNVNVTVK